MSKLACVRDASRGFRSQVLLGGSSGRKHVKVVEGVSTRLEIVSS